MFCVAPADRNLHSFVQFHEDLSFFNGVTKPHPFLFPSIYSLIIVFPTLFIFFPFFFGGFYDSIWLGLVSVLGSEFSCDFELP